MMKRYVEYGWPGIFLADLSHKELSDEDYKNILSVDCVKNCSMFRFYEREVYTSKSGDPIVGDKQIFSGWFYQRGHVKTLEDIGNEMPESILYDNMLSNKWERVICLCRQYYPLSNEDMVL